MISQRTSVRIRRTPKYLNDYVLDIDLSRIRERKRRIVKPHNIREKLGGSYEIPRPISVDMVGENTVVKVEEDYSTLPLMYNTRTTSEESTIIVSFMRTLTKSLLYRIQHFGQRNITNFVIGSLEYKLFEILFEPYRSWMTRNYCSQRTTYVNGDLTRFYYLNYQFDYPNIPEFFNKNWICKELAYIREEYLDGSKTLWNHLKTIVRSITFSCCSQTDRVDCNISIIVHKQYDETTWIQSA